MATRAPIGECPPVRLRASGKAPPRLPAATGRWSVRVSSWGAGLAAGGQSCHRRWAVEFARTFADLVVLLWPLDDAAGPFPHGGCATFLRTRAGDVQTRPSSAR